LPSSAGAAVGIAATYEVLAKLGEGGMGAVYKVRHRHLQQLRVIKVMRSQVGADEEFRRRFLAEAKLVAGLRHPQLVELFEFEVLPSGDAYMVLEHIDGFTLKHLLATSGPPSVGLALELAHQGLEVLGYLHGKGLVHRDVSPDNVMVTRAEDGGAVAKLIDLGIARRTETAAHTQLTTPGSFIGKVRYAAPEQFGMETEPRIDARSDLYSFGIVLYELLTGRYPIAGEETAQLLSGHLFKEPLPFAVSDPQGRLPEELRQAVLRCLRKKPEERFASAEELATSFAGLRQRLPWEAAEVAALFSSLQRPAEDPAQEATRAAAAQRELLAVTRTVEAPFAGPTVVMDRGEPERPPAKAIGRRQLLAGGAASLLVGAGAWVVWERRQRAGAAEEDVAVLAAGLDFGAHHALVMGSNQYQRLSRLLTARNDAQELAKLLETRYGFEVELLLDASRHQLLSALEGIGKRMRPQDHLLVYYAGHGQLDEVNNRAYWQPVDAEPDLTANWVSSIEVSEALLDSPASHVLVTADSCYSGAMVEEARPQADPAAPAGSRRRWLEEMLAKRGRLVLTSGGSSPVPDVGVRGHSVFARHLLDVLSENATILDSRRLYDLVQERMARGRRSRDAARMGPEQQPVFGPLPDAGDDGGEFFFVPVAARAGS
jgi:tRNA A-37 threonylcarbamoyl transferase component Bud32